MLYICIPSYNEAPTVGVLLWRIRKVFQEFSREYEVLVYDDGSTDATTETLAPYRDVMPLTVLGGPERGGYAAALDALCRAVVKRTRYPRRDAAIFLQGDFTDQPEHIPELVKRFEGGADVVVAERAKAPEAAASLPVPVRRLSRVAPWVLKPFVSVPGVRDPFGSYRLVRIAVLRDVVRAAGDRGVVVGNAAAPSWAANVELLLNAAAFARRVEGVELAPRYDVRPRETRIRPLADAMGLLRFARAARSRRLKPVAGSASNGATREAPASAGTASPASPALPEPAEVAPPTRAAATAERASKASPRGSSRRAQAADGAGSSATADGASGAEAGSEAAPSERRRSRKSRTERRRPARPAPGADAVGEDDGQRAAPARGAGDAAGNDDFAVVADVEAMPVEGGAGDDAAQQPTTAGTDAEAEEARRQRQRARRKRSRQRRAARDASRDQSSTNEAAPIASNDVGTPSALAEGRALAREDAPSPPPERESRREAEPAQTSPAASPVVQ